MDPIYTCGLSSCTMPTSKVQRYDSPIQLYDDIGSYLLQRERECNIILPHVLKLRSQKLNKATPSYSFDTPATSSSSYTPDFWLVLFHSNLPQFVLSCTNGPLGSYPVFIWSATPIGDLPRHTITHGMQVLAQHLRHHLPLKMARRVYSVFAPTPVAQAFVSSWFDLTGKIPVADPYFHCTFANLTRKNLPRLLQISLKPTALPYATRRATMEDVAGLTKLCFEFAAGSEPFLLDQEGARREALHLIRAQQVYVCEVEGRIACMVAITRSSPSITAVTKVVTDPEFLSQGWAKRLLKFVCQNLFIEEKKQELVLYVYRGNVAAEKVYHSLGFGGLFGEEPDSDLDPDWIEIGFHDTDLGHW